MLAASRRMTRLQECLQKEEMSAGRSNCAQHTCAANRVGSAGGPASWAALQCQVTCRTVLHPARHDGLPFAHKCPGQLQLPSCSNICTMALQRRGYCSQYECWPTEISLPSLPQAVVDRPFARVSYTDAVSLLQKAPVNFEFPVRWGIDLQSEHERYLVEKEFGGNPLFVTDYPRDIKVGRSFKTAVRLVEVGTGTTAGLSLHL